jgi:hypothetical protein
MVTPPDSTETVNLGIAIVVPAKKILEVLDHPELVAEREKLEEEELAKQGDTQPD